ncbi:hypothetical protein [Actinomadura sp. 6N118]|uniref:hypothetical protein n=1 Tax=Actinomadura sp. 6N118 TaxID=3375151 RepID=UPI003790E928
MTVNAYRSRRLVLKKNEPVRLVEMFAEAAGWKFAGVLNRDPEQEINYEARWNVDTATSVHYIIDDVGIDSSGQLRYMLVLGGERSQRGEILSLMEKGINVWTLDELTEIANLSFGSGLPDEQMRAMLRLGLGAPLAATEAFTELFARGSKDPAPIVRYSTLWGIVHAEWSECLDIVEDLNHDPHPQVSEFAGRVLEAFSSVGDGT